MDQYCSDWDPTRGAPIYGHWLHDAIPRLALLPEFPADTRIIVPPNLRPYQEESPKLLGVRDRRRPTAEEHLEVEYYFFSSPVSVIDCYNPHAVNFARRALLPKWDPAYTGPIKFFLQRTGKRRAVEYNDEICDFFRSRRQAVVKAFDLNFAQTFKLFSEAEAICSFLGSNMSNVIFASPAIP